VPEIRAYEPSLFLLSNTINTNNVSDAGRDDIHVEGTNDVVNGNTVSGSGDDSIVVSGNNNMINSNKSDMNDR
jgi:hypothetical protein